MNKLRTLLTWGLLAAATHVMGYTITVDPIQIQAGQSTYLIINLNNTETNLTAYQMFLYLPEGVTVQKKANGKYAYTANANRQDPDLFNTSVKDAADGSILIAVYSDDKDVLTGTSGELIRLPIEVASTVTTSLQGSIKNIEFTDVNAQAHKISDIDFTLTIGSGDNPTQSNAIACADITARSGQQVELPIMLTNDADLTVVGISFTLTLPEGVTVAKDEYDDPLYSLESTRLNPKRFSVYTSQYADGSWGFRISTNNTTAVLNGTEGVIMTLTLDIPDGMEAGDYNVSLTENKLSVRNNDNSIVSKVISDSVSKLTINNVIMGDVNDDGEVDLSDAIMVTYYSLHMVPANFIEAAADMNGDGEIDLSDAITIIYRSLGVQ